MCMSSCVWLRGTVTRTRLVRSGPVVEIRIGVHCGLDTLETRRPTHEMIQRSVPARAVKTRRRFRPETVSFHASVCSYVISIFTVAVSIRVFICIISCDHLIYFTSMITCTTS